MGRRLEEGGRATGLGPSCLAGAEEEEEEECTYLNHVAGSPTDSLGLNHRTYRQVRWSVLLALTDGSKVACIMQGWKKII